MKTIAKLVWILPLFLMLSSCTKQNNKKNGWDELNLKRKVKSVTEVPYEAKEKNGKIIKGKRTGGFWDNCKYLFDSKGNKIEEYSYNLNGSLYDKTTFQYNTNGNIIKANIYNSDTILYRKTIYKYDANGKLIEELCGTSFGTLEGKVNYKYDYRGSMIEFNFKSLDGRLKSKATYKYNANGDVIKFCIFNSDGSNSKTSYKYDANGNKIEENCTSDGRKKIDKYKYREIYKYEYDKKGNWIRKITYRNNVLEKITERTIEYFE